MLEEAVQFSGLFEVSFTLAFLGGILSLVSPCTISIVPAFVAITAHNKGRLLKSSLIFFAGFSLVFVLLGVIASVFGSFIANSYGAGTLEETRSLLVMIAGAFLVIFGLFSIFGKGFAGPKLNNKFNKSPLGLFTFGLAFGLGWSPCVGPILGGIITIAATLPIFNAALLLFSYSLGMWSFLFVAGILYDKYNLGQTILKPREFKVKLLGKERVFELISVISGLILVIFGSIFLLFRSESALSNINLFGSLDFFLDMQGALQQNSSLLNSLDLIVLAIIVIVAAFIMFKRFRK